MPKIPKRIKRMTMKIETFPKSGSALRSVFTSCLNLSHLVIVLSGYRILRTLNDLRVVTFDMMSPNLYNP
jgi:hypothetical protein